MNISFTPSEILHVFHTVLKTPMIDPREQEHLVLKIKSSILDVLLREEEKNAVSAFEAWSHREEKKIEGLKQKNLDIKTPFKGSRRK